MWVAAKIKIKDLKETLKKFPVVWNILRSIKDNLKILFRFKDVAMMMLLFQIWPEQTYRFSTRKLLPPKKNRFSKNAKPIIPFNILEKYLIDQYIMGGG